MSPLPERCAQDGLELAAPAKINLTLRITGRRADGYHLLDSLVVFTELGDQLAVRLPQAGEADLSLAIEGRFSGQLGNEPDNLVLRAARCLAETADVAPRAAFTLAKSLPVASGIGGGSSDAAAALHLLNRFWGLNWPLAKLQAIALPLGADVPVCLWGQPAAMQGIGEAITPLPALPDFALVLANPGASLSTGAVFGAREGGYASPRALPGSFADLAALLDWLSEDANDLEAPARRLCPAVGEVLDALGQTEGCRLARMSGSGATCFGVYDNAKEAELAADALKRAYPAWWIAASPLRQPSSRNEEEAPAALA